MSNHLKLRDKIELVVASAILLTYIVGFEVTAIGGEASWLMRLLVVTAAVTMFGDNVQKAREIIASGRDNHAHEED
jgi:hypothetical protein